MTYLCLPHKNEYLQHLRSKSSNRIRNSIHLRSCNSAYVACRWIHLKKRDYSAFVRCQWNVFERFVFHLKSLPEFMKIGMHKSRNILRVFSAASFAKLFNMSFAILGAFRSPSFETIVPFASFFQYMLSVPDGNRFAFSSQRRLYCLILLWSEVSTGYI